MSSIHFIPTEQHKFSNIHICKMSHDPNSSKIFVLFYEYVLFVLLRSVCCFYVNVYCTTATGWLPNCI